VAVLQEALQAAKLIAAYGAAGRATVYLNQMSELPFRFIVDESQLRLGKFVPGTGTPIVHPTGYSNNRSLLSDHRLELPGRHHQKESWLAGQWLTAFPVAPCAS